MLANIVHKLDGFTFLHPLTDYLSSAIFKEQRVIVEGHFSEPWYTSEGRSFYMGVPNDAVALTRASKTKGRSAKVVSLDTLYLAGHFHEKVGELGAGLEEVYIPLDHLPNGTTYSYRAALLGIRTIVVEDGRVYRRQGFLQRNEEEIFAQFFEFLGYEGFDRAFEAARH